jgi:hypothetical protein
MTRQQIKSLTSGMKRKPDALGHVATPPASLPGVPADEGGEAPLLPPSVRQFFLPAAASTGLYSPRLGAAAAVVFSSTRYGIEERRQCLFALDPGDGRTSPNWDDAERLPLTADALSGEAQANSRFAACPAPAAEARNYVRWEKEFKSWLRRSERIRILRSQKFRLTSEPGESEGGFRARLQQTAAEERDRAIEKVRKRYAGKATTLENRLLRARQAIERESGQSSSQIVSTAVSFGTAILGAVLGRKRLSASTASRVGSAIRSAGSARKQASDVARARETEAKVQADIERLNEDLDAEIAGLDTAYDAQTEELAEITIRPKAADVHVQRFGLLWTQEES